MFNLMDKIFFNFCAQNFKEFSYFSTKTYVVGTQKNRLNETVLLSTQNILKIIFTFLHSFFVCLTRPMIIRYTDYPDLVSSFLQFCSPI